MIEQRNKLSLLSDIKSHPDKSLIDHLSGVGNLCRRILKSKKLNFDEIVDFKILQEISYLIGITHDFGKATNFFQRYIREEDGIERWKLKNKPETHHAFISSIFTYYTIREYLTKKGLIEEGCYKYLPVISFLIVKRHHGNLDNALDETYDCSVDNEGRFEVIKKQINAIDFVKLNALYRNLYFDCGIISNTFKKNYKEIMEEINTEQKRLIRKMGEENTLFYYFITLLLYSTLLDADKTDAAKLKITERKNILSDIVDKYKEVKFGKTKKNSNGKTKINKIRDRIYNEVISNIDALNLDDDKILSLNVPTGTGKTLSSLSFALKLRERLKKEKGFSSRIIYSLPFLSIIDQNSDVFSDVLNNPTTDILLKHHHLSDISYTTEDEFENTKHKKDIGRSLLMIEGWNSEIIVTTFMQFFYSIVSNRNKAIRKFHNISNSIVIFDEVQAIPHKYWLLLKEAIQFLAKHFNTYFIFVTATQPLIFDEKNKEIKSLIKNKGEYFEKFDRVKLIPNLTSIDIENFKDILKADIIKNPNKDFLIVMNTIHSSKEIYDFIKDCVKYKMEGTEIYYLSTNIVPKERLKRINGIKKKTKNRKIIVSTQLIEAGVDISVDIVYRDFAPLDSINQVAGRCNRNFGEDKGTVRVFILTEKGNKREYYKYIYGSFITSKTKKVFERLIQKNVTNIIAEPFFLELNNAYFEEIKTGKSDDESRGIVDNAKKLKFVELSRFKLIKNEPYKVDVFIELDEKAKSIWQKYQQILSIKDPLKRKKEFLKIKKDFYEYVISVYKNDNDWLVTNGMNFIGGKDLKICYDKETGFKKDCPSSGTFMT